MQGKGGVGKSFVATIIAMFLKSKGRRPVCFDTDPVNTTFSSYEGLNVELIELFPDGIVQESALDKIIDIYVTNDTDVVVDNGATSFIPLFNYIAETGVLQALADMGKPTMIHTVVAGGAALPFTMDALEQLVTTLPEETKLVVWLNEVFGPIKVEGRGFEELNLYKRHKDRIFGIATLRKPRSSMFVEDLQAIQQRGMTFEEAINDSSLSVMRRQRIKMIQRDVYAEAEKARL